MGDSRGISAGSLLGPALGLRWPPSWRRYCPKSCRYCLWTCLQILICHVHTADIHRALERETPLFHYLAVLLVCPCSLTSLGVRLGASSASLQSSRRWPCWRKCGNDRCEPFPKLAPLRLIYSESFYSDHVSHASIYPPDPFYLLVRSVEWSILLLHRTAPVWIFPKFIRTLNIS